MSGQVSLQSGEVHILSGTVQVQSGLYLASGIYVVTPGGAGGGGQVSGAVIISGDIRSVLSGMVRALISGDYVIQPVATLSGQYLASGLYLASGIYVVTPGGGGGGGQVSGAVIISGDIRSVLSGMVKALISGDTVNAQFESDMVALALVSGAIVGANTNVLASNMRTTIGGAAASVLRVTLIHSFSPVFRVTYGSGAIVGVVNQGSRLVSGGIYTFNFPARANDEINWTFDISGTVNLFRVDEVPTPGN